LIQVEEKVKDWLGQKISSTRKQINPG
jgi:hypothetical protein